VNRFGELRPVAFADPVDGGHGKSIARVGLQFSSEDVRGGGRLVNSLRGVVVTTGTDQSILHEVADGRVPAVVDGRRPSQTDRGSFHFRGKWTTGFSRRASNAVAPGEQKRTTKLAFSGCTVAKPEKK